MSPQFAKNQPAGFVNRLENVAIVGVNGRVGQQIVTAMLANKSHKKITAITRADANTPIPAGLAVAKVDYNDTNSLVEALKGHDALIITMSVTAPRDTQKKLIDAAATAGVPWIFPNEYTYPGTTESFRQQTFIGHGNKGNRDYIESKGVASWVGIGCGFWYEVSIPLGDNTLGIDWNKKHVTWFDNGEQKITLSSLHQSGLGVAALLNLPILPQDENDKSTTLSSFRNAFACFGSFNVSQKDIFASILRVSGTKESDWTFDSQGAKARWEQAYSAFEKEHHRADFQKCMYTRVFFAEDSGDMTKSTGSGKLDNERLGLKEENLDELTKVAIQKAEATPAK